MRLAWANRSARRRSKRFSGSTDLALRPFTGATAGRVSRVVRAMGEESDRTFVRIFIIMPRQLPAGQMAREAMAREANGKSNSKTRATAKQEQQQNKSNSKTRATAKQEQQQNKSNSKTRATAKPRSRDHRLPRSPDLPCAGHFFYTSHNLMRCWTLISE